MTLTQLVDKVILKATGKVSTVTEGDTKWNKVLGIANTLIDSWEEEYGVDWESLYDPDYEIGTVTATDTFAIDTDDVRKLSDKKEDFIRIWHTDGVNYTDYETVPPERLKHFDTGNFCARIGDNLVFNQAFTSSSTEFGGTIKAPVYTYASALASASDVVPVDIPNWLVVMCAAEYVRNDVTRQNQYPNLVAEGNTLMQRMRENNDAQVDTVERPWTAPGQTWA